MCQNWKNLILNNLILKNRKNVKNFMKIYMKNDFDKDTETKYDSNGFDKDGKHKDTGIFLIIKILIG